jgi:hypothetical protein
MELFQGDGGALVSASLRASAAVDASAVPRGTINMSQGATFKS